MVAGGTAREHELKLRLDGYSYHVATPEEQREIGAAARQWTVVDIADQVTPGEDAIPVADEYYSEGGGFTFEGIEGVYELAHGWDATAPGKISTWPLYASGEETSSADWKGWLVAHQGYLYMLRGRYASKYALDELQAGVELAKVGADHDFGADMAVGGKPLSVNGKLLVPVVDTTDGSFQHFEELTTVGSPDIWNDGDASLTAQCFVAFKSLVAMALDGNQVRTADPLVDLTDEGNWAPAISGDGYRIGPEGSVITQLYVHGVFLIAVTDRGVYYMDDSFEVREGIPDISGWADDLLGIGGGYANGQLLIPGRGGLVRWAPDGDWAVVGPEEEGALEGDLTPGWGRVSGVAGYGKSTFIVVNDQANAVAALWSFNPPRNARVPYVPHSHLQEEDAVYEDVAVVVQQAQPVQSYAFGTLSDDAAVGTVAWSDPSNAGADDGSAATALVGTTHYLKGVNPAPGLPDDATLLGVELVVKRSVAVAP